MEHGSRISGPADSEGLVRESAPNLTRFREATQALPGAKLAAIVEAIERGAPLPQNLAEELRSALLAAVRQHGGFAVLSGFGDVPQRFWRDAFVLLCATIGELMVQDGQGATVREVRDRGTRIGEGHSRYSDSRYGGSYHTDGAELPFPVPDLFALLCVRPAQTGGHLRLIPVPFVEQRLRQLWPETIQTLSHVYHFDARRAATEEGPRTVTKPIVFSRDGRSAMTYLREYIEVGHAHPGVPPLSPSQWNALDRLDSVLNDPLAWIEGRLLPGEIVVIDNLAMLHGRSEFVEQSDPALCRLLYRTWISVRPPSAPVRGSDTTVDAQNAHVLKGASA